METGLKREGAGVLLDARLATLDGDDGYQVIEDGALAWHDGRLDFVGRSDELPSALADRPRQSAAGALVTPALIDCHTHLVFAGDRAGEFEMRLQGAGYEQIARAGGGIVSTVRATRAAGEDALFAASLPRAQALLAEGVTCIEIKSGYGLDFASERMMLRVARRIGAHLGIAVRTTFLGLHALPPEFGTDRAGYVAAVCDDWLPRLAGEGLVDAVDAFCEGIGFTPDEVRRCFEAARQLGLPVKLHAEQLSDLDGAAMTAAFDGLSADHLEWLSQRGIDAMARAGTVAVLLPGAFYALRETRMPPIAALREAGVALAVASDLNPGTSPMPSLRLAMNQACTLFRLTPEEALRGVTGNAAQALGLAGERGGLKPGSVADFLLWPCRQPAELAYWIGPYPRPRVFVGGRAIGTSAGASASTG